MSKLFIEDTTLSAIGDAIREKTGKTDLIAPGAMPAEIASIETGGDIPESLTTFTGSGEYRFAYSGWQDYFQANKGLLKTKDITSLGAMFYSATDLTEIPFEINCAPNTRTILNNTFMSCHALERIPKINNVTISGTNSLKAAFNSCYNLKEIPSDFSSWFNWDVIYSGNNIFRNCYSLRSVPMDMLSHDPGTATATTYIFYDGLFYYCYCLDEIVGLPIPYVTAAITNNMFSTTCSYANRLKNFTFATNEDGTPITVKWKNQTLNFIYYIGYGNEVASYMPADKQVTDDATYQALKNDPDWWTTDLAYSRYNHDSAVATINSLPDASAYIAANGGANTLGLKGAAGSATDGGAINTLTEEEIAVAAAKGWTVTLK